MHSAKTNAKPDSSPASAITFPPVAHRFAVLADTHVSDRVPALTPQLLDAIRGAAPEAIFLAGDLSKPEVMITLAQIAPV